MIFHPGGVRAALRTCAIALVPAFLTLQGCGRSNSEPPPPDPLKAQRQQMEKAKATEKALQDAAERQNQQIESQQK